MLNPHVRKLLVDFNKENEGEYFINNPKKVERIAELSHAIGFDEGFNWNSKQEYERSVTAKDHIGTVILTFDSITDAACYLTVNEYGILDSARKKTIYAGFFWEFSGKISKK